MTRVKLNKSIMTFIKYLAWTGIAFVVQTALDGLYRLDLPMYSIPIIASVLKAIATYVATQAEDCYDDD